MQCRSCWYDLRGLPTYRCPECGLPFDPRDPSTFGAVERGPAIGCIVALVLAVGAPLAGVAARAIAAFLAPSYFSIDFGTF